MSVCRQLETAFFSFDNLIFPNLSKQVDLHCFFLVYASKTHYCLIVIRSTDKFVFLHFHSILKCMTCLLKIIIIMLKKVLKRKGIWNRFFNHNQWISPKIFVKFTRVACTVAVNFFKAHYFLSLNLPAYHHHPSNSKS